MDGGAGLAHETCPVVTRRHLFDDPGAAVAAVDHGRYQSGDSRAGEPGPLRGGNVFIAMGFFRPMTLLIHAMLVRYVPFHCQNISLLCGRCEMITESLVKDAIKSGYVNTGCRDVC